MLWLQMISLKITPFGLEIVNSQLWESILKDYNVQEQLTLDFYSINSLMIIR